MHLRRILWNCGCTSQSVKLQYLPRYNNGEFTVVSVVDSYGSRRRSFHVCEYFAVRNVIVKL